VVCHFGGVIASDDEVSTGSGSDRVSTNDGQDSETVTRSLPLPVLTPSHSAHSTLDFHPDSEET